MAVDRSPIAAAVLPPNPAKQTSKPAPDDLLQRTEALEYDYAASFEQNYARVSKQLGARPLRVRRVANRPGTGASGASGVATVQEESAGDAEATQVEPSGQGGRVNAASAARPTVQGTARVPVAGATKSAAAPLPVPRPPQQPTAAGEPYVNTPTIYLQPTHSGQGLRADVRGWCLDPSQLVALSFCLGQLKNGDARFWNARLASSRATNLALRSLFSACALRTFVLDFCPYESQNKTLPLLISDSLRLEKIVLRGARLDDATVAEAMAELKRNRCLRSLALPNNHLTPSSMTFVADALLYNQTLVHLDLSHNPLGELGVQLLAGALGTQTADETERKAYVQWLDEIPDDFGASWPPPPPVAAPAALPVEKPAATTRRAAKSTTTKPVIPDAGTAGKATATRFDPFHVDNGVLCRLGNRTLSMLNLESCALAENDLDPLFDAVQAQADAKDVADAALRVIQPPPLGLVHVNLQGNPKLAVNRLNPLDVPLAEAPRITAATCESSPRATTAQAPAQQSGTAPGRLASPAGVAPAVRAVKTPASAAAQPSGIAAAASSPAGSASGLLGDLAAAVGPSSGPSGTSDGAVGSTGPNPPVSVRLTALLQRRNPYGRSAATAPVASSAPGTAVPRRPNASAAPSSNAGSTQ